MLNPMDTPNTENSLPVAKMHVSLNVRDIERSVAFYEAFFGVPAHKRRPGYANFDIVQPPLKLAMQENTPVAGVGQLSHLGIQVATNEDVQATRERLEASGLVSFDEGDTVCCYARQNKVWATDPDGNGWEVYVLLDDMTEEDDDHFANGAEPKVAGCCAETTVPAEIATILNTAMSASAKCGTGEVPCGC